MEAVSPSTTGNRWRQKHESERAGICCFVCKAKSQSRRFSEKEKRSAGWSSKRKDGENAKIQKQKGICIFIRRQSCKKDDRLGAISQVFDSEKEFARYQELCLLEKAGQISDMRRQVPLLIQEECVRSGEKIKAIYYVADFCYRTLDGRQIIEDVKGQDAATGRFIKTKDFNLKWKLLRYRYPEYEFRIY